MSIEKTYLKARQHVQASQYDAAIKLYRGLLRLTPKQPQINSLLGAVLIQVGQHEAASEVLEVALAGEPANPEHWVRLLVAHHRAGHVHRARELLAHGASIGIPAGHVERFRHDLSEPPRQSVEAVERLIQAGKKVSAEIAARLLVNDYPKSKLASDYLDRTLVMSQIE